MLPICQDKSPHQINSLWADFSKQMGIICFGQTTRMSGVRIRLRLLHVEIIKQFCAESELAIERPRRRIVGNHLQPRNVDTLRVRPFRRAREIPCRSPFRHPEA